MARSLNRCTFIGRLVRDPEGRAFNDGTASCRFTIAVDDDIKDKTTGDKKESAEFVNIGAIGKLAEICETYLKKGKQVYVEGKFRTRKYNKNGVDHYITEIALENMQMLGSRDDGAASDRQSGRPGYQPSPSGKPARLPDDDFIDEIPF